MKTTKNNQQNEKKKLKGYRTPTLKNYGKITALTSGGSTGSGDGQSGRQPP
jgi:hypothetical protein